MTNITQPPFIYIEAHVEAPTADYNEPMPPKADLAAVMTVIIRVFSQAALEPPSATKAPLKGEPPRAPQPRATKSVVRQRFLPTTFRFPAIQS